MDLNSFVSVASLNDSIREFTQEQRTEFNYYEIMGAVSRSVVEYRVEHHMNQKQLSELLGVSQSMVSKYESGDYNISIRALNELCARLGFHLDVRITMPEQPTSAHSPVVADMDSFPEEYMLSA